ncbi:BnaA01g23580D [Brassica napus]|uniref:(rape) hypothetical protein n=1 Tax=Brassica napus TaxID=3708 RepID=A0A078FZ96_BRANA|nr:unnamed protein product [Brassica napus]CDY18097.1 BnaA01g23580D [Brassica napus]
MRSSLLQGGRTESIKETPPWNLRTRQAACNELGEEQTSIIGVNRGRNKGCGDGDSQKLKFSVSLLMEEIEKYFTAFVGKKLPPRPKKRPRIIQNRMNVSSQLSFSLSIFILGCWK